MKKSKILFAFLLLFCVQVVADNIIDEVIWVVGDEAILRSEVEEERMRAQYEGHQIPGDPYCYIPEQLAVQKLFLVIQGKPSSRYADGLLHLADWLQGKDGRVFPQDVE